MWFFFLQLLPQGMGTCPVNWFSHLSEQRETEDHYTQKSEIICHRQISPRSKPATAWIANALLVDRAYVGQANGP